jgi:hypothetical protein
MHCTHTAGEMAQIQEIKVKGSKQRRVSEREVIWDNFRGKQDQILQGP